MKTSNIKPEESKKEKITTLCSSAQHAEMTRSSDIDEPCDDVKK